MGISSYLGGFFLKIIGEYPREDFQEILLKFCIEYSYCSKYLQEVYQKNHHCITWDLRKNNFPYEVRVETGNKTFQFYLNQILIYMVCILHFHICKFLHIRYLNA